jgi:hypothetical protein
MFFPTNDPKRKDPKVSLLLFDKTFTVPRQKHCLDGKFDEAKERDYKE